MIPDVFMIAYDEPYAARHFARLRAAAPTARLIEGVTGIREAYRACAVAAATPYFFAVDADNFVVEGFDFALPFEPKPFEIVIWFARNPVNGLTYGHGGIKLYPTDLVRRSNRGQGVDVATSWAPRTQFLSVVASEHRFNAGPAETWRAAFREGVSLSRNLAVAKTKAVLQHRLDTWCMVGEAAPFGRWSIAGARDGRSFATEFARDPQRLKLIKDFTWLREEFARRYGLSPDTSPDGGPAPTTA